MAINCVGWGDMDTPVELCTVLQHLEMAYKTYCSTAGGEMGRKVQVLKQSVAKVGRPGLFFHMSPPLELKTPFLQSLS